MNLGWDIHLSLQGGIHFPRVLLLELLVEVVGPAAWHVVEAQLHPPEIQGSTRQVSILAHGKVEVPDQQDLEELLEDLLVLILLGYLARLIDAAYQPCLDHPHNSRFDHLYCP